MQPNNQQPTYQLPAEPLGQPQAIGSAQVPQPQPTVPMQQPTSPSPTKQPEQPSQRSSAPTSTQNSLLFSEMRDNMIIMNDGSFRAIVRCQSINFDLMSSREREGVEFSYQNFLNSLYFPVQVLIRSRRVDIGPYIDRLVDIRRSQDNMLLNVLMDDYINFIDILAQEANIMDKSFYIIVPYYPSGDLNEIKKQAKGLFDSFFGGKTDTAVTKIDQVSYEKAKDEIKNRVDSVMSGLFQMGVKSGQLNTRQLGELFYGSYNPDTAAREPIAGLDPNELTSTYIRKGDSSSPQIEGRQ
ncbi:hypothetical protein B7Y94_04590 [Candidatus Saccharibacteria bacterium 32-49-12]|nr:MAG: hypothetical protein B7Y94_04590 [Candidatus Saccharibacteria bacterium 32-49-12]